MGFAIAADVGDGDLHHRRAGAVCAPDWAWPSPLLSPLVSAIDWRWLPPQISAYFVPSYQYFAFFPWAAFIAFGLSIGSILRLVKPEQMNRVMQWGDAGRFGLIIGGQYFSNMPYSLYPKSEFWLDSPGLIVIKLGVVMLVIGFAYVWTELPLAASWSWVRQLGTTSLLVYWVHIELVYGRWFGNWQGSLNNVECAFWAAVVVLAMIGLSVVRKRWSTIWPPVAAYFSFRYFAAPSFRRLTQACDAAGLAKNESKTAFPLRMISSARLSASAKANNPGHSRIEEGSERLPGIEHLARLRIEPAAREFGDRAQQKRIRAVVEQLLFLPIIPHFRKSARFFQRSNAKQPLQLPDVNASAISLVGQFGHRQRMLESAGPEDVNGRQLGRRNARRGRAGSSPPNPRWRCRNPP